jgi:hypothetical protein
MLGSGAVSPDNAVASQISVANFLTGDSATRRMRVSDVAPATLAAQTDLFRVLTGNADTQAIASLQSTGTNGALSQWYCGTQDPTGIVSANAGSVYFRVAGIASGIYSNRSAANPGTTWVLT